MTITNGKMSKPLQLSNLDEKLSPNVLSHKNYYQCQNVASVNKLTPVESEFCQGARFSKGKISIQQKLLQIL